MSMNGARMKWLLPLDKSNMYVPFFNPLGKSMEPW
jgi:hypothetical protein